MAIETLSTPLIADADNQKLRGGYYTPQVIAQFLANWAIQSLTDEVLEPSCGDGCLLEAAAQRLLSLGSTPAAVNHQIRASELYESEAILARQRLENLRISADDVITVSDFFCYDDQAWGIVYKQCDVVIGNPPFLRYHAFPEDQRERAFRIMRTAGLSPSKLTNSWVAFLVAASLRLKKNGRLAMVIPAELLQVKYAEQTRAFLAKHFGAITIVTFRRLVFDGIQQEVVLLLAEKNPEIESGIDVIELDDAESLSGYEVKLRARHHLKAIDHAEEKWIQYYLDEREIGLLRALKMHPDLTRFGQLGCVDVGVVTGNNSFFVMTESQVQAQNLSEYTLPLVGRTAQLPGLTYTEEDWLANRESNVLCHLLNLPPVTFDFLTEPMQIYVKSGEDAGMHIGFKCRNRRLWYIVPTLWSPDAFLFRQIHGYPKLVENRTQATSTDTIHRVRYHQPQQADQISLAFLNSMTFAFAEVLGRSYGGGVLELEPNEAEQIPIPFFLDTQLDLAELDRLERSGQINTILDITDKTLLQDKMRLDKIEIEILRNSWRKLSGRRMGRKVKTVKNGKAA
ncbi:MAG: N-6 DNA methylase [Janthinobacterium lividum]